MSAEHLAARARSVARSSRWNLCALFTSLLTLASARWHVRERFLGAVRSSWSAAPPHRTTDAASRIYLSAEGDETGRTTEQTAPSQTRHGAPTTTS
eukprot:6025080-Pyramimonas_sp.AAC.2